MFYIVYFVVVVVEMVLELSSRIDVLYVVFSVPRVIFFFSLFFF